MTQTADIRLGGRFTFPGTDITVHRMGYGAMQLAGPGVFGPPKDEDAAIAVLKETRRIGIDHIDTSDFYGPHITNQLIAKALHPYPGTTLVTKVGAYRDDKANWIHDLSAAHLRSSVEDNLRNLGLDRLDIVNLRIEGPATDIVEPMKTMRQLQDEGLIRHIGVSTVTMSQIRQAQDVAAIVCVQNHYNVAHREDDAMIEKLGEQGIAYVPYFPLGGFSPLQSEKLSDVAAELKATPMQVALAWLLRRAPNVLLIPGTSSVAHFHENVQAATMELPAKSIAELDSIGAQAL